MRLIILIGFFLFVSFGLKSQKSIDDLYRSISYHSDVVANAALETTKSISNKNLISDLEAFLNKEGSFDKTFDENVWISVKQSSEVNWRILTWELKREQGGSSYFGYIQHQDGTVVKLKDFSDEMDDVSYLTLDESYWYGALYYNMIEKVDMRGDPYYILFGYDNHDKFTSKKIADVLTFKEGRPVFGKEIFKGEEEDPDAVLSRIFIEYGSDANVSLNYNPGLGMIVYDHLIPRMGQLPGQGPTYYPDGSYCGYQPSEDGTWTYVDKLYDQISTTAPRPKPVLDKKNKKNIFGKKN